MKNKTALLMRVNQRIDAVGGSFSGISGGQNRQASQHYQSGGKEFYSVAII
jgi:hypothetical protein